MILLQNEINLLDYIIRRAAEKEMIIVLNPSPYNGKLKACDLKAVTYFLVNEVEAEQMTGESSKKPCRRNCWKHIQEPVRADSGKRGLGVQGCARRIPSGNFPGKSGGYHRSRGHLYGLFYCFCTSGKRDPGGSEIAAAASAIAVTRPGASSSIPRMEEVEAFLEP